MSQVVARDQLSAGGLALLVHLFFFTALVFGVSWKRLPEVPVYADLWSALPSLPEPPPPPPPEPAPVLPEPVKPPPPAKPLPPPKVEPPARKIDPDIALKEKKAAERKREEKLRAEEELLRQEVLKKQRLEEEKKQKAAEQQRKLEEEMEREELARLAQEQKQLQVRKEQERKAAEARKLAQEKARKALEDQLAADMADDLAAEAQAVRQQVAVSTRLKQVDEYKARIQMKIKGLLVNPPGLNGKPEAVYRVELLPNGEVVRAVLVKSSGQSLYDRAVESAILKASPLPLPTDRDAAAAFRDGLELKFRPD